MTLKKYPQNIHTPKIFIFLIKPKIIEIEDFERPKMVQAYVFMKYQSTPTTTPTQLHLIRA